MKQSGAARRWRQTADTFPCVEPDVMVIRPAEIMPLVCPSVRHEFEPEYADNRTRAIVPGRKLSDVRDQCTLAPSIARKFLSDEHLGRISCLACARGRFFAKFAVICRSGKPSQQRFSAWQ